MRTDRGDERSGRECADGNGLVCSLRPGNRPCVMPRLALQKKYVKTNMPLFQNSYGLRRMQSHGTDVLG